MMVHAVFILTVALSYILRNKGKQLQAMPFFVLFLFAGLRYMYGNDYSNYYYIHNSVQQGANSPFDEFLFTKLYELTPNFFLLIALTSFFFLFVVYRLMKNHLSGAGMFVGLTIFLINPYLFLMNLSALRQCLAMLCFIGGVHFGIRRKFLPYVLMVLLGTMFHKSAILLLPIYFILGEKPFKNRYVFLIFAALFVLLWFVDIKAVSRVVAAWFNDRNYLAHLENGDGNSLRATALTGISFIYVLANMPKLKGKDLAYAKLYLLGLILGILAYRMSMLTRIQMYFDIFSIIVIPTIMAKVRAEGPIVVRFENKQETVWKIINRYALPVLIFTVYVLRYYSFFTNPMWKSFGSYQTIFSVM